ncbi:hypothetical protein HY620_02480 [Candidatus Uhrbacteria bacterium]|nr:hypothetical protein [Candidatus Uhrbacteria bacterium]
MTLRIKVAVVLGAIAVVGGGVIIYMGRPVMSLKGQQPVQKQELRDQVQNDEKDEMQKTVSDKQPSNEQVKESVTKEEKKAASVKVEKKEQAAVKLAEQVPTPTKQESEVSTAQQPTQQQEQQQQQPQTQTSQPTESTASTGELTFTMAQVAGHSSSSDCWAAINGSVYDLTSWISRHPGGPERIIQLCGTDGSQKFNTKHSGSQTAQRALFLLKIGTLQ